MSKSLIINGRLRPLASIVGANDTQLTPHQPQPVNAKKLSYSRVYGTPSMAGALARERRIISATIAAT
jgi:hypothetical protein